MKRRVLIFLAIFLSVALYAQEAEGVVENTAVEKSEAAEKKAKDPLAVSFRVGADINGSLPMGSFSEYSGFGFGGGAVAEIGIPIQLMENIPVAGDAFKNFGVGIRAGYNVHKAKGHVVSSVSNSKIAANVHTRIPVANIGLSIVPSLGIGIDMNFLAAKENYAEDVKPLYLDQIYQFGLGLRYANNALLKGNLEFELAPVYSISPEQKAVVQTFDIRLSVLYKIL